MIVTSGNVSIMVFFHVFSPAIDITLKICTANTMKFLPRKIVTLPFVYLFVVAIKWKVLEAIGSGLFAITYHSAWHIGRA